MADNKGIFKKESEAPKPIGPDDPFNVRRAVKDLKYRKYLTDCMANAETEDECMSYDEWKEKNG